MTWVAATYMAVTEKRNDRMFMTAMVMDFVLLIIWIMK